MTDLYSIYIDGRLDPKTELYDFKIERSRTGWQTMAIGSNLPAAYFHTAHKLKMVFKYFKG